MFGLAQVKFSGRDRDRGSSARTRRTRSASFFAADRATDEYNYTTTREDIAMMFEEVMMFRNHGWRRDMAFTDKITSDTTGFESDRALGPARPGRRRRSEAARTARRRTARAVGAAADPNAVQNLPAPIRCGQATAGPSNLALPAPLGGLASIQSLRVAARLRVRARDADAGREPAPRRNAERSLRFSGSAAEGA